MKQLVAMLMVAAVGLTGQTAAGEDDAAAAEREKALRDPYANDLGPDKLPEDLVKGYPENVQAGYKLLVKKCAVCHTPSRPLNSQFVESDTWKRYVKRMMRKPGCEISSQDGKVIWQFLVHDSKVRKTGKSKAAWDKHRADLLAKFKEKHPERYELLYGEEAHAE